MMFRGSSLSLLALSALFSPALSQLKLPGCIRNCIDKSPDTRCSAADIACLCRASSSAFLPNLVTCIHDECVNLEPGILLGPLELACSIAGAPIPDSIIQEVESKASYLATAATTTVTRETTLVSSVVVTTTEEGSTQTLIYPVTIEKTKTISGEPSTVTGEPSTTTGTQLVPVLITTTDSAGSTYTTTTTALGALSTYTTTNSDGETVTRTTTVVGAAASSGSSGTSSSSTDSPASDDGTTTILTSTTVAGQAFTSTNSGQSSARTSTTGGGSPASQTNSAPFTNTNVATGLKVSELGSWLGLGVALAVGALWF